MTNNFTMRCHSGSERGPRGIFSSPKTHDGPSPPGTLQVQRKGRFWISQVLLKASVHIALHKASHGHTYLQGDKECNSTRCSKKENCVSGGSIRHHLPLYS